MIQSALEYTSLGWRVLPIHTVKDGKCSCLHESCTGKRRGKHSRIMDWVKRATIDKGIVSQWWQDWPDSNIGICTGIESGILVLDIDIDGLEKIKEFDIPNTPTAKTGSGGLHYIFRHPGTRLIASSVGLLPGFDIRSDGGMIVAAPSVHWSGNQYEWIISPFDCDPAEIPEWLDILLEDNNKKNIRRLEPVKDGETIKEGSRDEYIFSRATDLVWHVELDYSASLAALQAINQKSCNPPLSEEEVTEKLNSAWKKKSLAIEKREENEVSEKIVNQIIQNYKDVQKENINSFFIDSEDMELSPPVWIVKDMIEADSLSEFFGPPGVGKSFAAIDLACCVASGLDFHSKEIHNPGLVLYIAGEGKNGLKRRIACWKKYRKVEDLRGKLFISKTSISLIDPTFRNFLASAISQLPEKPALIVIDTWARNLGGDENSSSDTSQAVQTVDNLRGKSTCIIVHHSGKQNPNVARGSSALKGALDTEYVFTQNGKVITMQNIKIKDGKTPEDMNFELVDVELLPESEPGASDGISSAVLQTVDFSGFEEEKKMTQKQQLVYEMLERVIECSNEDYIEFCKNQGFNKDETYNVKKQLLKKHKIFIDKENELIYITCKEKIK